MLQNRVLDATLRGGTGNRDQVKEDINEAIKHVDAICRPAITFSTEVVTPNQQDYSLSADFGLTDLTGIREIVYQSISGAQPWVLEETTAWNVRQLRQNFVNSTYINLYALEGLDTLLVYPVTQNVGDLITIHYVERPLDLILDEDVPTGLPPEWHELYEIDAIQRSMRQSSPEYAMSYTQLFDKKLGDYRKWRNKRGASISRRAILGRYGGRRLVPHDNSADWRW
jgi:hypothetical protein